MWKAFALTALSVLVAGTVGCKDITPDVEALADRTCACKDKVCADKAVDDLVQLMKDNPHATGDEARAKKAGERIGTCAVTAGVDPNELMTKLNSVQQ